MSNNRSHSTYALLIARLRTADWRGSAVALLSVIAGCILAGLLTLRIPEHRAYQKARVRHVGVRLGSKRPGVQFGAELPDGRIVWFSSQRYNPGLRRGASVCIQELHDRIWGGAFYQLALPGKCDPGVSGSPAR